MIRVLLIVISFLQLTGCDGILKKTVSIVELTSKLTVDPLNHESVNLIADTKSIPSKNLTKFKITSNRIISEPLIVGDIVYSINNKASLTAYSLRSRKIIWSKNIDDRSKDQNFIDGGLVIDNNRIMATLGTRFLIILNAEDGYELSRKEFPDLIKTKPAMLTHNIVLIQTISNHLIAYDINLSKILWAQELPTETIAASFNQSPIVYKDGIIVFNNNGSISYLTAKLGQELWMLNLSKDEMQFTEYESSAFQCSPIFKDEFMYVATSAGKLVKIDLIKGKTIWQIKAEDVHSLNINQNNLILTNNAKQVACLSLDSGKVKWAANLYSSDNKKNIAVASFSPFISKMTNDSVGKLSLNAVTSDGLLYSYAYRDQLVNEPSLIKIPKNLSYVFNQDNIVYLFDNNNLYKFE